MTTEPTGLPPELEALVEVSRSSWVPGPIETKDFHGSLRRRIRRRNARNGALMAGAALALVLAAVQLSKMPSQTGSPSAIQEFAEQEFIEPVLEERPGTQEVIVAEGNLPDLSPEPVLDPWFHHALQSNLPLTGLAAEYGALGGLYLSGTEL